MPTHTLPQPALHKKAGLLSLVFGLLFVLLTASSALAQNAQLAGIVMDSSKAAVPHASLVLTNTATQSKYIDTTSGGGFYTFPSLIPGTYTLTVSANGFDTTSVNNVTIAVDAKATYNVMLKVGKNTETVSVDASGLELNTTDASVSTVIDSHFVEEIPLNGRSFQSLMELVPGVTAVASTGSGFGGDMVVNGQRTEGNYYLVDGVSATNGVSSGSFGPGHSFGYSGTVSNSTAIGTTQSMVSIDALEEFRAVTSTYSAEYGRSPGGQFSFSTKSGSNRYHGLLFEYVRNTVFDANNYLNKALTPFQPRQPENQNDFGGTFSGPVIIPKLYNGKDKTFFFFSYEGLRLTSSTPSTTFTVPSLSLRQNAPATLKWAVNGYPLPNGADLGDGMAYYVGGFTGQSKVDTTGLRVDHTFNDKFKVFARFNDVPSSTQSYFVYDIANTSTTGYTNYGGTAGATYAIKPNLVNDLRFNYTANASNIVNTVSNLGGAVAPDYYSVIPGYTSKMWIYAIFQYDLMAYFGPSSQPFSQNQINLVDWLAWSKGRHNFRIGVDYRRLATTEQVADPEEYGAWTSQAKFLANTTTNSFVRSYGGFPAFTPTYVNYSAYLQDEWKVTPRLSLSLGVRWDVNPAPKDKGYFTPYTLNQISNLATATLAPAGTDLWATTYGNVAPRIGLAYQLHQSANHETVLRGGFGTFYDTGNEHGSAGYQAVGSAAVTYFTGSAFPLTAAQLQSSAAPSATAPYNNVVYAYDHNLQLPITLEWNVALQQMLGAKKSFTLTYVGSAGDRQLLTRITNPYNVGNAAFSLGNLAYITTNGGNSNYNSLQATYQMSPTKGLQTLLTYTWAHSIDNVSSNSPVFGLQRSNSDTDIRNSFQAAAIYAIPGRYDNRFASAALAHWSLDTRVSAVGSTPINILGATGFLPDGTEYKFQPNYVAGQPLYITGQLGNGGPKVRQINRAAFTNAYAPGTTTVVQGNVPRNAARGFDAVEINAAVHREIPLTEKIGLQFRAEAFNVFNHTQFGSVYNTLSTSAGLFGLPYTTRNVQLGSVTSLYQTGGPRSLQFSVRAHF